MNEIGFIYLGGLSNVAKAKIGFSDRGVIGRIGFVASECRDGDLLAAIYAKFHGSYVPVRNGCRNRP
jgi:hypothetical protein